MFNTIKVLQILNAYISDQIYIEVINILGFNSLLPSDAIWVNIGSWNGLLHDGTRPLLEPMLTYHK